MLCICATSTSISQFRIQRARNVRCIYSSSQRKVLAHGFDVAMMQLAAVVGVVPRSVVGEVRVSTVNPSSLIRYFV